MDKQTGNDILKDVRFKKMVKQRNRFAIILSLLVLMIYLSFMGVATFHPAWLAQPFHDSHITRGMPIAALVIITSWIITGIYIWVANHYFDQEKQKIKKEHHYE
ncbi:DUF485 domain-containing protein [Acinetobacter lactucae]|uniref:DUF485 domain-containing protein n=1 Tax=Acinetobacter lactucae TaxID=1785128 RepID=A0A429K4A3_9GAMM|nr:DUF485 domain-containing protein [Acinetobacter lactucae]RSO58816.1 DUF485 domain-containing protein [Acinetobacter lactucae]